MISTSLMAVTDRENDSSSSFKSSPVIVYVAHEVSDIDEIDEKVIVDVTCGPKSSSAAIRNVIIILCVNNKNDK